MSHGKSMTAHSGLLALLSDSMLRDEVDRVAAAVGLQPIHVSSPASLSRSTWSAALAVVVDEQGAQRCTVAGWPRRAEVFVVALSEPTANLYHAAMSLGAQSVLHLPAEAGDLVTALSGALDGSRSEGGRGEVVAVIGGRGGAGASVFATALAQCASQSMLVDLDTLGGGIDLLLGTEALAGLRWPDVAVKTGRLTWDAVRQALPAHRGVTVLSGGRDGVELEVGAVEALVDAGRRGGAIVVCDLPRRFADPVLAALDAADLVVVVCPGDVRSCAATAAIAPMVVALNPNAGLVVRGPSPGGLRAADVADIAGLPLLASMRPEPMLAERLERGALRLRFRSPLAGAATRVLSVLGQRPGPITRRQAESAA